MNPTNIPDALQQAINKLERTGYRVVRIVPNPPEHGGGHVAYLSKRLRTGLRLAQVEIDEAGQVTTNR
jgi:phosphatidylserine/phosphatidylglycerophosphate/cardiolipin synthase-like enzyme